MRVEWSNFARDDLDDLVQYISRDSLFYARRFGEKIVLSTLRLGDFPESGRIIPETEDKHCGKLSYKDIAWCVWKLIVF